MRQMELGEKQKSCQELIDILMQPDSCDGEQYDWVLKDLLQRAIEWAAEKAPCDFDDSFIHSLYMQFHDKGRLTEKQVFALIRIVTRFEIE